LVTHGLSGNQVALLEDDGGVSKNEVNGAGDERVSVELPVGVCVECVLEGIYATTVYDGFVGAYAQSHCLLLLWACSVLEPYVLTYKSIPHSSCKPILLLCFNFSKFITTLTTHNQFYIGK